jgi:hypothetical protein
VDNKVLLTVVLVLFAVAAALVVFAPGEQERQAVNTATAPSKTEGATPTAVVSTSQDVQAGIASGADQAVESQAASDIASGTTPPSYRVIATYFHNTARCVTCRSIEQRSRDTIQTAFAAEIASGRLAWRALNMEEKENEHYAIDYDLPYASLVLAEMDGEREVRFKVLDQTWDLVHKKQPLLEDYVESETRAFLEGH